MYLHTMVTQLIFSLYLPEALLGFPRQLCVFALEMMAAHYASFSDCGPFGGSVQPYVNWKLSAQGHVRLCHVFRKNHRGINSCILITLNIHNHTHMHNHKHTLAQSHTYNHTHTYISAQLHTKNIYTHMQPYTQSHKHVYIWNHTQKHPYTYIYTKELISLAILHFASEAQIFDLRLSSASWKQKTKESSHSF